MKKSKLLQVMSILIIILGAIGLFSAIASFSSLSTANEALVEAGGKALPGWYPVLSIISALVQLAAGITGVMYKSKDSVKIMGIVYLAVFIITFVVGMFLSSTGFLGIISIIFPILYLVGWAKSE